MAQSAGERLKALRKAKDLTEKQLAVLAGVSEPTISRWENKTFNATRPTLEHLADVLDVRLGYLSDRDEPDFARWSVEEIAVRESYRLFMEALPPRERTIAGRYQRAITLDTIKPGEKFGPAPRTRAGWRDHHAMVMGSKRS